MKKKGFTLVELLVVIAIIALLMSILMPALSKVRKMANRIKCGSNISGLGKSMLIYANDNDEEFPVSGGRSAEWANQGQTIADYTATLRRDAYGTNNPTQATIGSSLYLLIKYADAVPAQFVCGGDEGREEFEIIEDIAPEAISNNIADTEKLWDFSTKPGNYYSYSYQMPFVPPVANVQGGGSLRVPYPCTASSDGGRPVMSDRNPWLDINANNHRDDSLSDSPDWPSGEEVPSPDAMWSQNGNEYTDPEGTWNSASHDFEGQNVLYVDGHVDFAKSANVGIDNDNLWWTWGVAGDQFAPDTKGKQAPDVGSDLQTVGAGGGAEATPFHKNDAYMASEMKQQ